MCTVITNFRIDSIEDYYTPSIKGTSELKCTVQEAPAEAILGKGQFGTVVRCRNRQHLYAVALKAVAKSNFPKQYDDAKRKKKFQSTLETLQNEVKQLRKLTGHPSIVALYEVLETSTHLYFATEICKGQELFHAISHYGAFSESDAASVMKDILSAINFMHSHSVMHRDLKPENILLTIRAEKSSVGGKKGKAMCSVKVVDFGLASDEKRSNIQAGTPYYIAPEVLNASETRGTSYGKECDIWSLGVILYIMLCGYPPFYGESDQEIYDRIKKGFETLDDRYPAEDWDTISSSAQDLIQQMLTFKPQNRPTADVCRNHAWITEQGPTIGLALHDAVMAKLVKFQNFVRRQRRWWGCWLLCFGCCVFVVCFWQHCKKLIDFFPSFQNKFKQVAKRLIAETLDDRDIAHLKEAFNQYDTDGDGTISIVEMRNALTHGKSKLKNIDQNFLDSLDIDGDGMIDYSEFLVATMRTKHWHTTERLRLAFDQLDVDNSGQLDRDEVRSALGGNDDALADEIINQFDVDGDGMISFEEFESMMTSDTVKDLKK